MDVRTEAEKFAEIAVNFVRRELCRTAFDKDRDENVDVRWAYVGLMMADLNKRLKHIEERLGIEDEKDDGG